MASCVALDELWLNAIVSSWTIGHPSGRSTVINVSASQNQQIGSADAGAVTAGA
jgi:hypothetical protein